MNDQSKTTAKRKRGLSALLALAGTRKSSLIWAGILSAFSSVLSLTPLIVIYLVLLRLAGQKTTFAGFWPILGWGALAMGLRWLLQVSGGILAHLAAFNILFDLRLAVADKLRRVPMGWITARSAESTNKVLRDDVDRLELFIAHHLNDSAAALTLPLVSAIALFYLDWRMALVTLVTVPLAILVQLLLWKKVPEVMREYNEVNVRLGSQVVQYVQGIAVIKTYHHGAASNGSAVALPQVVAAYFDVIVRMVKLTVPAWSAFTVVIGANMLCILPFGGYWYLQGSLPLELFVLCLLLGLGITRPLFQLAFFGSLMRLIQDGYGRIQDLMEAPELPDTTGTLAPVDNSVEFVRAGFAYGDVNVLQDISFKMAAGSLTAIVGPSGAGKSTLAQLLVRFWDVQQGAINIGGVDVRELPLANMPAQVAYVMQDVFLFHDTVLENIRLGREDISEERVIAAATAAQAHDFIGRLPQGYQTVLGERGARLSGGEKQRLSIARALVKDAPVIVLDEATAFSDPINEAQLLQALGALTRDKTVMVIAHRLSTIINADQIVVLDAGSIIACGKHAQLLEDCVLYRQLWQLQSESASWKIKTASADEYIKGAA
ncbi:ABC transporter ATP-binding protein [Undibacterium sp. Di27W]